MVFTLQQQVVIVSHIYLILGKAIYIHLWQVCRTVSLLRGCEIFWLKIEFHVVTETCTNSDCIAIRMDLVSKPIIYSLDIMVALLQRQL